MQSMWAGTLIFGPVGIPVRLGPATRPRELAFRQVHAEDGGRITFRRSCTACGADVPFAEVAKAYQTPGGGLVPLADTDLARLPLEAARRIDVQCFVEPGTIDPLLISRSYFLLPDAIPAQGPVAGPNPGPASGPDAARAFDLFRAALAAAGRVAVARITLRQRESRAALWPRGSALVLQTLLTPDEIAEATADKITEATPDEIARRAAGDPALARLIGLITTMTAIFDPAAHHDGYRDQLEDLVRGRAGRP